ncbi:hypothetical protein [Streptomyces sp. NBC_01320]|uniref:hypothetical protein n=1 Tax=Streptomyces sp. NBC_01320 TaxID=2903824 RepID=UPI003FA346D5
MGTSDNTDTLATRDAHAQRLRSALIDQIQKDGHVRTPAVETALRTRAAPHVRARCVARGGTLCG